MYRCKIEINHNRYNYDLFSSLLVATMEAKRYAKHSAVTNVIVTNTMTGEIMYSWNNGEGEYIAPSV